MYRKRNSRFNKKKDLIINSSKKPQTNVFKYMDLRF